MQCTLCGSRFAHPGFADSSDVPSNIYAPRHCKPWSQIAPTAHFGWYRLIKQDDELTLADQSTLDFGEDDLFELEAIAAEKQQNGSNVYLVKYRVGAHLCLRGFSTVVERASFA